LSSGYDEVYVVVSLMSDARVMFLVWFILIAIIVALILIVIETRVRKKQESKVKVVKVATPAEEVDSFLSKKVSVKSKLKFIGKTAKSYFRNKYGMPSNLDYFKLVAEFEKGKNELEADFCEKMFKAYYSGAEISEEDVSLLGKMFAKIVDKREGIKDVARSPGFFSRFDELVSRGFIAISNKVEGYVDARKEDMERHGRRLMKGDYEMIRWVRRAIAYGYDKVKVEKLLRDGKRSNAEVRKFLIAYDKEAGKSPVQSIPNNGIAKTIVGRQKKRLEKMEVLSSS